MKHYYLAALVISTILVQSPNAKAGCDNDPLCGLEVAPNGEVDVEADETLTPQNNNNQGPAPAPSTATPRTATQARTRSSQVPAQPTRPRPQTTEHNFSEGDTVHGEIYSPSAEMIIAQRRSDGLCETERTMAYRQSVVDTSNYNENQMQRYNERYQELQQNLWDCYEAIQNEDTEDYDTEDYDIAPRRRTGPGSAEVRTRIGVESGWSRNYTAGRERVNNDGNNSAVTAQLDILRRDNLAFLFAGSLGIDQTANGNARDLVVRNWNLQGTAYLPLHSGPRGQGLEEGWNFAVGADLGVRTRSDHWARVNNAHIGICVLLTKNVPEGQDIPFVAICPISVNYGWGRELADNQLMSDFGSNSTLVLRNIAQVMNFTASARFGEGQPGLTELPTSGPRSEYIDRAYQIGLELDFAVANINGRRIRLGSRYHYSSYRNLGIVPGETEEDVNRVNVLPATRSHQMMGTVSVEF